MYLYPESHPRENYSTMILREKNENSEWKTLNSDARGLRKKIGAPKITWFIFNVTRSVTKSNRVTLNERDEMRMKRKSRENRGLRYRFVDRFAKYASTWYESISNLNQFIFSKERICIRCDLVWFECDRMKFLSV